jgi:formate dehydrogenase major subunit
MAAMVRKDGVYLLPACTQFETSGSCTASNRSLQWRERVITPLFDSQTDHAIMYAFAKKFGYGAEFVKNYKIVKPDGERKMEEPEMESVLREINRGMWTIGYTGQSPERLKLHMKHMNTFNLRTLRATGGPCDGDYFGLPWPCYGSPEIKHPGSPNLYMTSRAMMDGGGCFRANFGIEREGVSLLAEDGSFPKDSELTSGYPEFDHVLMKKLGWWDELTEPEKKAAEGKNWKTDLSGGIQRVTMKHGAHPWGNAKARAVVWNFPDGIPQHREPLYSPRPDLVAKYPTHDDKKAFWRLPTLYKSVQEKNKDISKDFPLVLTSGRLVEFEGAARKRAATRGSPSCSRRTSSRSTRRTRTTATCATASTCGRRRRPARRSRSRRWSPSAWGRERRSSRSTSRAGGRDATCSSSTPRAPPDRARRGRQHRHDVRLRLGHDDAGNEDHPLPGREGLGGLPWPG